MTTRGQTRGHSARARRGHERPPIPRNTRIEAHLSSERSRGELQEWDKIRARGRAVIGESRRAYYSRGSARDATRSRDAQAESSQVNADESINDESAREARWGVERAQRSTQQDQQETTVQGERERENQDEQSSRYELWHDAAFTLATLLSLDEPPEELLELLRRDLTAQPAHLEENAAALQDPAHQILAHQALNHDLPTTELPSSPEEIAQARAAQLSEQFGQITGPYGASRYLAWDDKPSRPQPLAASLVASRDVSELIGEPPPESPKIGARFTQRRRKRRLAKVRAHYQNHAST